MSRKKKKLIQKFKRHYVTIKTYLIPLRVDEVISNDAPIIHLELKDDPNLRACYVLEDVNNYIFTNTDDHEQRIFPKADYNVTYRVWRPASTINYIVQPWGSFKINDLFWKGVNNEKPRKPLPAASIIQ